MGEYNRFQGPIDPPPIDHLRLIDFRSERPVMDPQRVAMGMLYQFQRQTVFVQFIAYEREYSLKRLMDIAVGLQDVKIKTRFPVTHYIRRAVNFHTSTGLFSIGACAYAKEIK